MKFFFNQLRVLPGLLCIVSLFYFGSVMAQSGQDSIQMEKSDWKGFIRYNFRFENKNAWIVAPRKPLQGNPWVWRAHFPNWHITMDSLLLEKGFYIAYINTNDEYGAPAAMRVWDKFYNYLTTKKSFARKVALEGVSRGGLYVYAWAKRNPDKVSCIYAEAPVCDLKSWPGGKGGGKGDPNAWKQMREIYGYDEQQAINFDDNPIDHLEGLASFKVPILHVVGLQDKIVPPDENTFELVQRYMKLGGPATVYPMTEGEQKLNGHHFEIEHPEWWADFIYKHCYPVKNPLPYPDYYKIRNGMSRFVEKIKNDQPVTVAFLGGSITYNPGWRNRVCEYLQVHFPNTKFHFIAAGIPSLGSLPHAFRLQKDVLGGSKVDLLLVEAAVNDKANGTDSLTQIRALEGIVRHAKKNSPDVDIAIFSFADPDKLKDYSEGKMPVEVYNHELVAQHYQLPSLNLAKEVYDKIQADEFSWQYDFKNLHPATFGQELYFQSMKSLLNACFNKSETTQRQLDQSNLPEALDKYNFNNGYYLPVQNAKLKNGWKLISDWAPEYKIETRKGFVHVPVLEAVNPGAELSLSFTGTAIGMAIVSGPDAGIVEYSIDGGNYQRLDVYTKWSKNLYLPWYVLFSANLKNKKHKLRLRMAKEKNIESKGNACQIVYFLVNR